MEVLATAASGRVGARVNLLGAVLESEAANLAASLAGIFFRFTSAYNKKYVFKHRFKSKKIKMGLRGFSVRIKTRI